MRPPSFSCRLAVRTATVAFAAVAAVGGLSAAAGGADASVTGTAQGGPAPVTNPYAPAYHHAYRHGALPTKSQYKKMQQWASTTGQALSASNLQYGGGGVTGIGVTTGHEKVYLVFYGSQWGTQGTDGNGNVTLSGDPQGVAPYLQQLFKGLGTGGELWSGVMTQYCDGVAAGAQSCPASNTEHVAYPSGGALAGVWADESTRSPHAASATDLGAEAVSAAAHFGNTTPAANRDAQYVIVSPTGTRPDGFGRGFCAWHSYNGAVGASSTYGDIAFTNLPYIPDVIGCEGAHPLDGVSIVEGHEYAETITDQIGAGGWYDSSGNETGDKCAWNVFYLTTATGTFAMQTTWANDGGGGTGACEASHPFVGNTVTVTSPGSQTGTAGTAVSLQISASDSASGQTLTYSASGLPPGLSINSSSGLISGTSFTAGTYNATATATDTSGAAGSASFTLTINSSTINTNPLFRTVTVTSPGSQTGTVGTAVSLQISASDSASGQTLTYSASGLPAGLSVNSSSGLISGTPTTPGTYNATVTATDPIGAAGSASFTWTISS
jgi:serine protease